MNTVVKFVSMTAFAIVSFFILGGCTSDNNEESWNNTVNQVSSGVVSIQTDMPMAFDGSWNRSGYATGFIVDAERGIILTNRHVTSSGPITAKAILINNEEIDLAPLYFDPVHDFGFFKYDPSQIKHITPHEFTLSNTPPHIGESIRIIGNDAGQKISILDGTISRLDRDAPNYGKGNYNDFNTFYIQAATSSTGGSSGSPVINVKGEAVALNAGSQQQSANAFYFPLERIKLALVKLQNNQPIERGTLQTTFVSTTYTELHRLGLSDALEAEYRDKYPDLKGLLVARKIVPGSHAAKHLNVGDILLSINQTDAITFSQLENELNNNVGKNVELRVIRGDKKLTFTVKIDDLHTLTPQSLVKFDGSIFHTLSYQQARHFNRPIKGVYVAASGGFFNKAGLPSKSVIVEFNGETIDSVEALNSQLTQVQSGKKVNLRYFDFSTPNSTSYRLVEINRQWFDHSYCHKEQGLTYWPCEKFVKSPSDASTSGVAISETTNNNKIVDSGRIEDALVNVSFSSPYSVKGLTSNQVNYGTGVIVDIQKGWVVVAQSVALSLLGDVKITFNNRYELVGKVEYVHPLHNLTLVSFNPTELNEARVSQVILNTEDMKKGEVITQMGLNYDGNVEYRTTEVDSTEEFWLRQFNVPRFVDKNIEATHFINPNRSIDGILINADKQMVGMWIIFDASADNGKEESSSIAGFSSKYVADILDSAVHNNPIYSLDIDLTMLAPVNAIQMGLAPMWLDKIAAQNPDADKVLAIYNISNSSNSADYLQRSDLLLAINDIPVSSFKQVEELSQAPSVKVTYFSEGEVHTDEIATNQLNGTDIDRVIYWSGLYLHAPHRAAQLQGNVGSKGVYIASYKYGSPATRYGLYPVQSIVEIDGKPIANLDDFVNAVKDKPHQASVVVKTIDFNNDPSVVSLRVDNHYWPFYEVRFENGKWHKKDYPLILESTISK